MTAVVAPTPALDPPDARKWLVWLIVGLLTLAAVEGVRIDRESKDIYLTGDIGAVITDDLGRGVTVGREHQWDLMFGTVRVPLPRWSEGV